MSTLRIGVGSGNPVKRRAVELALGSAAAADLPGDPTGVSVESVAVDSGVSEQPTGHAETVAGAENRAAAALDAGTDAERDLGVGIEGGVGTFAGTEGRYLIMWAAVTDGDRLGRGAGPSLALPDSIAARVADGEELGPVMDDALDTSGIAKRGGAAGAFTAGRVDRAEALAAAVSGALGPFVSDTY